MPLNFHQTAEDRARIVSELRETHAKHGLGASIERLEAWSKAHPTKPCAHCEGRGLYVESLDGATRRAFVPPVDLERERLETSCPECRGLGRVFISVEEHRAEQTRAWQNAAFEYRALRKRVCAERAMTTVKFDALVARRIVGEKTPASWVQHARDLAREMGVDA